MNFADRSAKIGDTVASLDPALTLLLLVVGLLAATMLLLIMVWRQQRGLQRALIGDSAQRDLLFNEMARISGAMTQLNRAFEQAMTLVATGIAEGVATGVAKGADLQLQIEAILFAVRDLESRLVTSGERPALRPPAHFSAEIAQIVRDLQKDPL